MAQELALPPGFGQVSSRLAGTAVSAEDLGGGITAAFAVIGFKGKVWSIKHRGEVKSLMRADGTGPIGSINVVIVKAAPVVSKTFYASGYVEGNTDAPDCWSIDGVKPVPTAPKKQAEHCATCKQNMWGSRMTEGGKQAKACSDNKRIAVVPEGDLKNEIFGGPMMLRIPPASLSGIADYAAYLKKQGLPYFGVVTALSFDFSEAYPLITFKPVRALTDAEVDIVIEHQNSAITQRMLSEALEMAVAEVPTPAEKAAVQAQTTQPTVQPTVQPTTRPNPFTGGAQGNADGMDIPTGLRRTSEGNGTAQASTTPAQQVTTVAVAQPVDATPETPEQMVARLQAEISALKQAKPAPRKRTTAPSPTNGASAPEVTTTAGPATAPAATTAPDVASAFGGGGAPAAGAHPNAAQIDKINAELDALIEG